MLFLVLLFWFVSKLGYFSLKNGVGFTWVEGNALRCLFVKDSLRRVSNLQLGLRIGDYVGSEEGD